MWCPLNKEFKNRHFKYAYQLLQESARIESSSAKLKPLVFFNGFFFWFLIFLFRKIQKSIGSRIHPFVPQSLINKKRRLTANMIILKDSFYFSFKKFKNRMESIIHPFVHHLVINIKRVLGMYGKIIYIFLFS